MKWNQCHAFMSGELAIWSI